MVRLIVPPPSAVRSAAERDVVVVGRLPRSPRRVMPYRSSPDYVAAPDLRGEGRKLPLQEEEQSRGRSERVAASPRVEAD